MAGKDLPSGSGIYVIEVGRNVYVGQTKNFNTRLSQHIRNAYSLKTNEDDERTTGNLYPTMNKYRLKDLVITIYTDAENYGIPDFDSVFNRFLNEWEPVGKRFSRNSENTDQTLRLDFAEIYHIMYQMSMGANLCNEEMGGQSSGWTSRQKIVNSILSKNNDRIKLLTRKTPIREAYQTFLRGAIESMGIAEVTEMIYDDFFADDWTTRVINKFLGPNGIGRMYASSEILDRRQKLLSEAGKYKSWSQFFNEDIIPYLNNNMASWVAQALEDKEGVKTTNAVRTSAKTDISNFIQSKFLKQRARLASDIVCWLFQDSGTPEVAAKTMVQNFDFEFLAEYISQMVEKFIVSTKNEGFLVSKNEKHIKNVSSFKPIRFSVVWESKLHKDRKTDSWITKMSSPKGSQVSDVWLKYRSFLLFDEFMEEARTIDFYIEPVQKEENGRYYVPMYHLDRGDWLSTRLHRLYIQHAPGYSRNWLDFYRPMISLWRKKKNRAPFKEVQIGEWNLLGYEGTENDALVVYHKIKNFVNDVTEWEQLKIY